MNTTYQKCREAADYIQTRFDATGAIGLVLGSGLGELGGEIEEAISVDYAEIPNFPKTTVPGHEGKLIYGKLNGARVLCMKGRFHFYEGHDMRTVAMPTRVMKLLGVKALILTNAAGAVNTAYRPGDIMVVSDHIKLNGASPLRGPNVREFGDRFFDMSRAYDPELRKLALACAEDTDLQVHEGVYMFFPGPQFETPAEIRAARILGADAVGMSTVTEVITAAHCHLPVLCLSVMTNMAAGILGRPLTTDEVDEAGRTIAERFSIYVTKIISNI